jgi:hypothetical protein
MEHPIVQQAMEILGGELLDIRRLKSDGTEQEKHGSSAMAEDSSEVL